MSDHNRIESDSPRLRLIFLCSLFLGIAFVLLKAFATVWYVSGDLLSYGNDSLMRLISVRNLLDGQGWFDTVEYRLMPPEGTQMHWSRYIDAVLAGLIVVFSWFMSPERAEVWMAAIWPVGLSIALILVVGFGVRRLFGMIAASFAVLMVAIWPVTQQFYFLPGRIDHHNVQILLIIAVTLLVLKPARPLRSGAIAGALAALGLAIGLETLLLIVALGFVLFIRANLRSDAKADPILLGFSVALFLASVVLWIGQTDSARLGAQVCDQLGLPVVSLTAIACVASVIPMLLLKERAIARLVTGVAIVGLGIALAWPMLGPCLGGPYGDLPPEVRDIISNAISEALPAFELARRNPVLLFQLITPVAGAFLLGGIIWIGMPRATDEEREQRAVVGTLLILCLVGLLASMSQIRLLLMSASSAPLLTGMIMAVLVRRYLASRDIGDALMMFVAGIALVAPLLVRDLVREATGNIPARGSFDAACRDAEAMDAINALPPSVFLASINLGPVILAGTHHSTVAGPYHRSPEAFANGRLPFRMPEDEMRAYIATTNATHLMLCAPSNYGDSFAEELRAGATTDWLVRIPVDDEEVVVFEIAR